LKERRWDTDLFTLRSVPGHIRSDNGPEFVAEAVQDWLGAVDAQQTAYTTRAASSPWENGFIESFNARLRVELRRRDLHVARGADCHRELAPALQRRPATCRDRLPGSSPGGVRASSRRMVPRSALN